MLVRRNRTQETWFEGSFLTIVPLQLQPKAQPQGLCKLTFFGGKRWKCHVKCHHPLLGWGIKLIIPRDYSIAVEEIKAVPPQNLSLTFLLILIHQDPPYAQVKHMCISHNPTPADLTHL